MYKIEGFRPVHPFPARMAPSIALDELPAATGSGLTVLDPMAGSGTTLVVARSRGHLAVGFDTDPLARLISGVWCADIKPTAVLKTAEQVHAAAAQRWRKIRQADAYPEGADEETRSFVRYWFDAVNRRQLRAIADEISSIRDRARRNTLWCAFSRLIIAKARGASYAMDLSHSRPHRVLSKPPFRPLAGFLQAARMVVEHVPFSGVVTAPKAMIRRGDARSLPLGDGSVDVVITSPPYLNAIDYMRCNKFSLIWMGHRIPDLRELRSRNIGTEVSANAGQEWLEKVTATAGNVGHLPARERRMLVRYVWDMNEVMSEIARVLAPDGRCIMVIGDCTMRGVFVRNSQILRRLGHRHGLRTVSTKVRELPADRRYLPPPSSRDAGVSLQGRMREEIVLTMVASRAKSNP
jgi:SAM-dependent methyltransferase